MSAYSFSVEQVNFLTGGFLTDGRIGFATRYNVRRNDGEFFGKYLNREAAERVAATLNASNADTRIPSLTQALSSR